MNKKYKRHKWMAIDTIFILVFYIIVSKCMTWAERKEEEIIEC